MLLPVSSTQLAGKPLQKCAWDDRMVVLVDACTRDKARLPSFVLPDCTYRVTKCVSRVYSALTYPEQSADLGGEGSLSDFGRFIKSRRVDMGLSLREAAKRIQISHNRLAELEKGLSYRTANETRPGRELVLRIAASYALPYEPLMAMAGFDVGEASLLAPDSREVVTLYESLSEVRKGIAIELLRALAEGDRPGPRD